MTSEERQAAKETIRTGMNALMDAAGEATDSEKKIVNAIVLLALDFFDDIHYIASAAAK